MREELSLRECPRHPEIDLRRFQLCPVCHLPPYPTWQITLGVAIPVAILLCLCLAAAIMLTRGGEVSDTVIILTRDASITVSPTQTSSSGPEKPSMTDTPARLAPANSPSATPEQPSATPISIPSATPERPTETPSSTSTSTPSATPAQTQTPESPIGSLQLIDGDTDRSIMSLSDGMTINLGRLSTANLNIVAIVTSSMEEEVRSVAFYLDKEPFCMNNEDRCVENVAPYAMAGDIGGDYYSNWNWYEYDLVRTFTIRAIPCANEYENPPCFTPLEVTITVTR